MISENLVLSEIEKVQNPSLGAWILWEYGQRFQATTTSASSNILLFFLVLPICLHTDSLKTVNSTFEKSGLGKFCEKMNTNREELFAIHERALKLRALTLDSISFGLRAGLFELNYDTGELRSLDQMGPRAPERLKPMATAAKRLGAWFESVEAVSVFSALRVKL